MIDIRMGEMSDVEKAYPLIDEFVKEAMEEYGFTVSPENAIARFESFVDYSVVAFDDDKMIGLIAGKVDQFEASDQDIFNEQVWFVSKQYRSGVGKKILEYMENVLREDGVSFMIMAQLGEKRCEVMDRFYKNSGYKMLETHYLKKL